MTIRTQAVTVRHAGAADAAAIARIYNEGIEDRLATLETELRTAGERADVAREPGHRRHQLRRALGRVTGRVRRAQDFRAKQLLRRAAHRGAHRPGLGGVRVVTRDALRLVHLAATLGFRTELLLRAAARERQRDHRRRGDAEAAHAKSSARLAFASGDSSVRARSLGWSTTSVTSEVMKACRA